ncbi:MAG: type II toxin-antitoxin system prevent-host-death family antitoxin [Treponema sp.]|jgi:prevent-host-death family protein|nr:type II toxin-antitoxin system prevent-host-death family antitoxin [Treponema sp.]
MQYMTIETAQKELDNLIDNVSQFNEPAVIVSHNNKTVIVLSMEEWNSIQETFYLQSIPGMTESIKNAASEPLEHGRDAKEVDWGV